MGLTNHGNQDMTYEYYEEATAEDFNKRFLEIIPRGIYKDGHLKKVTDSEITLSPFMAEIGDDDEQISVETSQNATLNSGTLDSGSISSATPYIVLRWNFLEQINNYVEVHAIANVATALSNDIIVGKCVFDGSTLESFDYTDRTLLNVQNIFLRVEPTEDTEMKVWVRGGRIHTSSQCIVIPEQKVGPFSVPGSPNSRIDLVYVDTDGTIKIEQGSQGVSPSIPGYKSKLVIAEVTIVNGDMNIVASRITDVRSFIASLALLPDYLVTNKIADQCDSQSTFTKLELGSVVKRSGIPVPVSDVVTLEANISYYISYNITFVRVGNSPDVFSRLRVISGDTGWGFGNNGINAIFPFVPTGAINVSLQHFELSAGQYLITLSGTYIITPSEETEIQLEARTKDPLNHTSKVTEVSLSIWS